MGRLTSSLFRQPKPSRVLALANLAYQDTTRSFGCANRPWTANAIHCAERGLLHGAICFFGVLGSDLYLAPSVVSQQVGVEVEGSWRFTCHSAEDKLMLCGSVVLHGPGIRCYFQMEVYESYTYEFMKWLMDTLLYHLAWEKLPLQLVEVLATNRYVSRKILAEFIHLKSHGRKDVRKLADAFMTQASREFPKITCKKVGKCEHPSHHMLW